MESAEKTTASRDSTAKDYNTIFERFVGDGEEAPQELLGIVAYGIYKHAKREWASDIHARFNRPPSDEELRAYHSTWTPSQIQNARRSAQQVLAEYADYVISEAEPRILREAVRGTFWPAVGTAIFSNALYTVGLIVVALILAKSGIDLLALLSSAASS
ncbi:hypothetical protein [Ciceribacter sp. RN22]|uniref:hypothetical protein n=1 Tax=Ciceribacter sp. RN22 TaxID=2954932 RepID=UPI002093F753|nr:hypothetical protein [Ciceribacter sp. RN22]MCO6177330.1 hypothetical protein [Ciceribacter sp. RN22]